MSPERPEDMRAQLEAMALLYHKRTDGEGEGEYGCPGLTCPGVQRLLKFAAAAFALGQSSRWQPIETLPHGRSLIGYVVKLPERWVRVGLGAKLRSGEWLWHQDVDWAPATHGMLPALPDVSLSGVRRLEIEKMKAGA